MPLPALDRWERKLQARGGYVQRRSGRFTKPGIHPRATDVIELRPPTVGEQIPGRDTEPTGGNIIWPIHDDGTTLTVTSASGYSATSNWLWLDDSTSATTTNSWINTTPTHVYDNTTGGAWLPLARLSPYEERRAVVAVDRRAQLRARIRAQLEGGHPNVWDKRRQADFTNVSQPEIVALQLLKKMLSNEEWRRYLRYGFIMVRSEVTGIEYQVYRGGGHIWAYRRGKKLAELCIHISDRKTPPTDRVIAKKIMLEGSELEVWLKSNIHCCQEFGYGKNPKIEDLIAMGAEGLIHDVQARAAAGGERPTIFSREAAQRSIEPIFTIGSGREAAQEFIHTSGFLQTA